jgi:hypothetical protein
MKRRETGAWEGISPPLASPEHIPCHFGRLMRDANNPPSLRGIRERRCARSHNGQPKAAPTLCSMTQHHVSNYPTPEANSSGKWPVPELNGLVGVHETSPIKVVKKISPRPIALFVPL